MFSRKDVEIVNSAETFSSEETLDIEPTTKRHVLYQRMDSLQFCHLLIGKRNK
jgi:hypothetical protein